MRSIELPKNNDFLHLDLNTGEIWWRDTMHDLRIVVEKLDWEAGPWLLRLECQPGQPQVAAALSLTPGTLKGPASSIFNATFDQRVFDTIGIRPNYRVPRVDAPDIKAAAYKTLVTGIGTVDLLDIREDPDEVAQVAPKPGIRIDHYLHHMIDIPPEDFAIELRRRHHGLDDEALHQLKKLDEAPEYYVLDVRARSYASQHFRIVADTNY